MSHPKTTITLFRHSSTEWSVTGRFAGATDIPLSVQGIERVQAYRARHGVSEYSEVLASPLHRAVQTAELLGYTDAERNPLLRERDYGNFEGMTTAEIRQLHPGWNVWTDPIPHGEHIDSFTARVDSVVEDLKKRADGHILIISHAHWIRLFTARWLGLESDRAELFRADTLGQTVLGWEREHPVMLAWNR